MPNYSISEVSTILAIETSCDETAAAILKNGVLLSNVVVSQLVHAEHGGIVPNLAAGEHSKNILPVVEKALDDAGVLLSDIDYFAATCGPGLIGGLIVGATFAKTLAVLHEKPFIAVNHLAGHALVPRMPYNTNAECTQVNEASKVKTEYSLTNKLLSNTNAQDSSMQKFCEANANIESSAQYLHSQQMNNAKYKTDAEHSNTNTSNTPLNEPAVESECLLTEEDCVDIESSPINHKNDGYNNIAYPYMLLLVSGGHSQIILVHSALRYTELGTTLDDAVGEVFDKVARMLGFGYPGGKHIEQCAINGDGTRFQLPRPMFKTKCADMSFSGLKTAARLLIEKELKNATDTEKTKADICASFQYAVRDVLIKKLSVAFEIVWAKSGAKCSLDTVAKQFTHQRKTTMHPSITQQLPNEGRQNYETTSTSIPVDDATMHRPITQQLPNEMGQNHEATSSSIPVNDKANEVQSSVDNCQNRIKFEHCAASGKLDSSTQWSGSSKVSRTEQSKHGIEKNVLVDDGDLQYVGKQWIREDKRWQIHNKCEVRHNEKTQTQQSMQYETQSVETQNVMGLMRENGQKIQNNSIVLSDGHIRTIVISGGVAANRFLLNEIAAYFVGNASLHKHNAFITKVVAPPLHLCTDNAGMIAWAAHEMLLAGYDSNDIDFQPRPRWRLDSLS